MLKGTFPVEKFKQLSTPFYYYDVKLLQDTLDVVKTESGKYGYHVHYAVKANANPRILSIIAANGLGADCVSGGEVQAALDAGFPADKIVFAGVGKADWEINLGLDNDIFCFNVESAVELGIINELAAAKNKVASIALRINPEVEQLKELFGAENVYDFSGINKYTNNIRNYYEGAHYRPCLGRQLLDSIYATHEPTD